MNLSTKSCSGLAAWGLLALSSCGGSEPDSSAAAPASSAAPGISEVETPAPAAPEPEPEPAEAEAPLAVPASEAGAPAEPARRNGLVAPDRGRRKRGDGTSVAGPDRRRDRGARSGAVDLALVGDDFHDFGTVRQGTRLRHEFPLDTTGKGDLLFQTLKTTCECATKAHAWREAPDGTRTELEMGDPVPAGERLFLVVESGTESARGPFHSSAVLYTSADPVHVELRADVVPVLDLVPATIALGRITVADEARGSATVRSTEGRAFRLEQAAATVAQFQAELVPIEADGEGRAPEWRVDVRLAPSPLVGLRTYRLNLVSDLATGARTGTPLLDFHVVELIAEVEVTEAFRAEPQFVTFGRVKPGQQVRTTVEIECLGEIGFPKETRLRLEPVPGQALPPESSLAFALHPREDGRTAELEARLLGLPEGSSGSYGAILVVSAGVPGLPDLKLRLYLSCASVADER